MAMVPLGCSRKCVSPFPVPRHSFPTERHRHIPEGLCFILRGAGHGKGAGWTRKMSCREGVCRLAKPGWAALAGGEGFPEEVLAGRLTVPLWELCKPPQHCPLLLQLALLLHIQGGCLTPHIHTVQQACHHLQDDVLADCTPFLWAESRESEGWKARPPRLSRFRVCKHPPRVPFSFPCRISEPLRAFPIGRAVLELKELWLQRPLLSPIPIQLSQLDPHVPW